MDPRFAPWAYWLLQQAQGVRVISTFRSGTLQRKLYRRYQAGLTRYRVLPPGLSKHEVGLAMDLVGDEEELQRLGAIWRKVGGIWGLEDAPHFEPGPTMLARAHPDERRGRSRR